MRNSIGGAWLLTIVLTFMAIFIAYIAITINYGNAFEIKTKMIEIIEKNNGLNSTSISKIENMLDGYNYHIKAKCPIKEDAQYFGITDGIVTENPENKQNYCVYREVRDAEGGSETKYYYEVYVFFNFSLPVLGDLFTFKVNGSTGVMYYPYDSYFS